MTNLELLDSDIFPVCKRYQPILLSGELSEKTIRAVDLKCFNVLTSSRVTNALGSWRVYSSYSRAIDALKERHPNLRTIRFVDETITTYMETFPGRQWTCAKHDLEMEVIETIKQAIKDEER